MSKYLCLMCLKKFRREKQKLAHMEEFDDHVVVKKFWRARFLDWFFSLPGRRLTKFVGAYLVYIVFVKHFCIEWSMLEATLIGIGLGLAID